MSTITSRSSGVGGRLADWWRRGFSRRRVVTAAGASDVGRLRANNEDYFVLADLVRPARSVRGSEAGGTVMSAHALLLVADGMGGAAGGEIASAMAAAIICSQLEDAVRERLPRTGWHWRRALGDAFAAASERIHARAADERALLGMGTTATAAVVAGDGVHVAHVGDSRAYLIRAGLARRLTRDHTWLAAASERGGDAAADDPRRHALLRALGSEPEVSVDTEHVALEPHDTLILCTDGLWSVVEDGELARAAAAHRDLGVLCETLLALASARGGRDNATVLAARLEAGPAPA